jgi:hypothetical protein
MLGVSSFVIVNSELGSAQQSKRVFYFTCHVYVRLSVYLSVWAHISTYLLSMRPSIYQMRYKVITATMKMTAFWVVAPCNLVDVDRCFRGAYCLHNQDIVPHPFST